MAEDQLGQFLARIATNGSMLNQQMGQLIQMFDGILPFSGTIGSFTCAAAATTTVTEAFTQANSVILITPTNAAAGTLQAGTNHLYLSARTAGVSFAFATAAAGAAAGTETFIYIVVNIT